MTSQEFADHLTKAGSYTAQSWRCQNCGAVGEVLFHKDDTPEKQLERLEMSHKARRNRGICPVPAILRTE